MQQQDSREGFYVFLLTSLFAGGLVISGILAAKLVTIGPFVVPAGVLAFSLTFIVTDIISEVYGSSTARRVVFAGFIALLAALVLIQLALALPSPAFWPNQQAFSTILGTSSRIILASVVAYLVSQNTDVFLFEFFRKLTGGSHLWLRNNLSTVTSQLLDSVIFVTIAFYGVFPIMEVILGQWAIKVAIAIIDTPFVYAGVWWIRRNSGGGDANRQQWVPRQRRAPRQQRA